MEKDMIRLVKFILFAVQTGLDRDKLNYPPSETFLMCTIRRTTGLENIGIKQDGPHVAVAVTDVQWLITIMSIHPSFVVDSVGNAQTHLSTCLFLGWV